MLSVENIWKHYGATAALRGVSLTAAPGEIISLLGPSGCGKSTLLKVITGLEAADRGVVAWGGADLTRVPVHQRGFGLMFQDYALFPHRNVFGNIAFGLQQQGRSAPEIRARVAELVEQVGLAGYEKRSALTLSGGEQQRVALARALAPQPRLLMLDEPLGALDRTLREGLLHELAGLLRGLGQTTIYVTHDQSEAFALSDRVAVMQAGQVVQVGAPAEVYARPATAFVARFMGLQNIVAGVATDTGVRLPWGDFSATLPGYAPGAPVTVLIHPEAHLAESELGGIRGVVTGVWYRGGTVDVELTPADGPRLRFTLPSVDALPTVNAVATVAPQRVVALEMNDADRD